MDLKKDTTISVILPNFNGKELLAANLPSIYVALAKSGCTYEIIVADDFSSDSSLGFIKAEYPDVKIVRQDKNRGFSSTCNLGISAATSSYICITNTDVTFDENYFLHGLKVLENSAIFAVKGDIFNYAGSPDNISNVDKTTRLYFKRGFLRFRTGFTPGEEHSDIQEFSALGCCFLCTTAILKSLGGFAEIYSPYYWEDSDLAIRAIREGYQVVYEPKCIVYHMASSTIAATQKQYKRDLISRRNKFIFAWRHMSGISQWCNHLLFIFLSLLSRWLLFDFKYYVGLFLALIRTATFRQISLRDTKVDM